VIPLTRVIPERIRGGYDDALYKSTFTLLYLHSSDVTSCCLVHFQASANFCHILCLQLKELNHDNIKSFVGACVEPGHICYLMQCCSRGTIQASPYYSIACI